MYFLKSLLFTFLSPFANLMHQSLYNWVTYFAQLIFYRDLSLLEKIFFWIFHGTKMYLAPKCLPRQSVFCVKMSLVSKCLRPKVYTVPKCLAPKCLWHPSVSWGKLSLRQTGLAANCHGAHLSASNCPAPKLAAPICLSANFQYL